MLYEPATPGFHGQEIVAARRGTWAAQAAASVTVAELLALRRQAEQTQLAAGQTIRRAVGIYAQATKQHAELVRASRSPQARSSEHGRPAGSSLAQLLQPLLAGERPRPSTPGGGTEGALPAVRSVRGRELRRQLEGSLATIRRQVRATHHQFQSARQAGAGPGAGHLQLVRPPEWPPTGPAIGDR